jgi:hypothetical protein
MQANRFIPTTDAPNAKACHANWLAQIADNCFGIFHRQQNTPSPHNPLLGSTIVQQSFNFASI